MCHAKAAQMTKPLPLAAGEKAESKTFQLSDQLSVEITIGFGGLLVGWDPDVPESLTRAELEGYRRARNEMIRRLAEKAGISAVIVEVLER